MTTGCPLARISSQIVVLTLNSLPGKSPKAISSRTTQAIQRSSVTRATAAKPIPVVRQTTSRIDPTASILATEATSSVRAASSLEAPSPLVGDTVSFASSTMLPAIERSAPSAGDGGLESLLISCIDPSRSGGSAGVSPPPALLGWPIVVDPRYCTLIRRKASGMERVGVGRAPVAVSLGRHRARRRRAPPPAPPRQDGEGRTRALLPPLRPGHEPHRLLLRSRQRIERHIVLLAAQPQTPERALRDAGRQLELIDQVRRGEHAFAGLPAHFLDAGRGV